MNTISQLKILVGITMLSIVTGLASGWLLGDQWSVEFSLKAAIGFICVFIPSYFYFLASLCEVARGTVSEVRPVFKTWVLHGLFLLAITIFVLIYLVVSSAFDRSVLDSRNLFILVFTVVLLVIVSSGIVAFQMFKRK